MYQYKPDSYHSDFYPQQYFVSSSSSGLMQVNPHHLSNATIMGSFTQASSIPYQMKANALSSIVSDNPYNSCFVDAQHPDSCASSNVSHQSGYLLSDNHSPKEDLDFREDQIRLKLLELERALLNDNDEDLVDNEHEMIIEEDWAEPIKSLLLPNSPKESCSESSISCIGNIRAAQSPKELLYSCATAISEGCMGEAQTIITELRQTVSIQGEPSERLAAYLVEGLAARIASSGRGIYKALKCKDAPSKDQLSAMQILFEICPCFKFGFLAANYVLVEAVKSENRVHIIDFDVNQGTQYINLIQTLSTCPNKPKHLRLTGVDDPESVQREVGGLAIIGQRLELLAEELGVPFEFNCVASEISDVTPAMLGCRPGEALVVNFAFQLHHMPDESVSTVNQRDKLLRMVKSLGPKLVTVVEQDVNTNTAPFLPRFAEVYNYYSAIFESLDATMPRESADRMNVERQCLAREIVNIIACEGVERIERYEAAGKWRARMMMAGFRSSPFCTSISGEIKRLLKTYCSRYTLKEENGMLHFGWEDKILVVASAWK